MTDPSAEPPHHPIEADTSGGTPWVRWTVIGCLGILILGIAGIAAIGLAVVTSVKSSGAYQQALATARATETVREALGEPIEEGWWVMGSVEVSGPSGEASISFPLSGPRGDATVYADARKRAGEWTIHFLEAELPGGERADLLDEHGASLEVVREFLEVAAAGDYDAAHADFSRPLAEAQPLDEFAAMASANASLFDASELRLERVRGDAGPRYEGTLLLVDGVEVPASFELVRENGEWRLLSYDIGSS